MAEVGGIRKMSPAERRARGLGGGDEKGVTYAYRGIDQLAAAAQPLFGRYGVVLVPTVLDQETMPVRVGSSESWSDTFVEVRYDIYGPGGVDDHIVSIVTGQGRDNFDKGINKAMTTAFKNLLLRLLCVGDPQDDTDGHNPGADDRGEPMDPRPEKPAWDAMFERVRDFAKAHPQLGAELREWAKNMHPLTANEFRRNEGWMNAVGQRIEHLLAALPQATAEDENQDAAADAEAALADAGMLAPTEPTEPTEDTADVSGYDGSKGE